jgi:hypothetical protein
MWASQHNRKPRLLLRLFGLLLSRYDARALFWLLFQEPPRHTRALGLRAPHWQCQRPKYEA